MNAETLLLLKRCLVALRRAGMGLRSGEVATAIEVARLQEELEQVLKREEQRGMDGLKAVREAAAAEADRTRDVELGQACLPVGDRL